METLKLGTPRSLSAIPIFPTLYTTMFYEHTYWQGKQERSLCIYCFALRWWEFSTRGTASKLKGHLPGQNGSDRLQPQTAGAIS